MNNETAAMKKVTEKNVFQRVKRAMLKEGGMDGDVLRRNVRSAELGPYYASAFARMSSSRRTSISKLGHARWASCARTRRCCLKKSLASRTAMALEVPRRRRWWLS